MNQKVLTRDGQQSSLVSKDLEGSRYENYFNFKKLQYCFPNRNINTIKLDFVK